MLLNVIPIIIDLIEKFNNPIIISPLIEFLNNLLEKTRYSCPEVLAFAIQNPSFKKLLQNDSEILRNAICDMFKSLIASFCTSQHISNIVIVALDFIDQSFQLNLQYEGGFLMLWLLISKEFNPGEKDVALIAMNNLYKKYLKKILCWRQENDMEIIVEILEENMLISFEEIDNNYIWLIKFIEEKYEFSNKMTHPEYTLTLKISILSLFASLLLKIYNQKQEMDFKVFEVIFIII